MKNITARQLNFFIKAFEETFTELGYTELETGKIRSMFLKHLKKVLAEEVLRYEADPSRLVENEAKENI